MLVIRDPLRWSLHALPASAWILSRYSGFLLQFKVTHVWLGCDSKLAECECVAQLQRGEVELVQGAVPSELSDTPVVHELITAGRRCAVIGKGTVWTVWEKLEKNTIKKNVH